jgi:replicative DNA helicase
MERQLLGDLILSPDARSAARDLGERDLAGPGHGHLLCAVRALEERGDPVDPSTVAAELAATTVSGDVPRSLVVDCVEASVTPLSAAYRVGELRKLAIRRRVEPRLLDLAQAARTDDDPAELLGRIRRIADDEQVNASPASPPVTAADAARLEWSRPMPPAISTGIASLDDLLGGGLREASTYVIAGATGRGKTGLAIQIARAVAPVRPVVYVTTELARRQILARAAAQALSATWRDLLALEPAAAHVVVQALDGLPLYVVELGRDQAVTAVADQVAQATGQAPVLVLDYLQHAARRGSPADYRLAVAALSDQVVRWARDSRSIAVVVSSMARGSASTEGAQTDARAAAAAPKESGDVEYDSAGVMLLAVGEREPDGTAPTRLVVGKSRYGTDGVVGLRFRGAVGVFVADATAALSALDASVLEAVAGGASTVEAIRAACERRKPDVTAAVRRLARAGHIVPAGQHGGWRVR